MVKIMTRQHKEHGKNINLNAIAYVNTARILFILQKYESSIQDMLQRHVLQKTGYVVSIKYTFLFYMLI